ncbi:ABC transporter permease subunit [Virgibacillus halodenitrificans]|uniref:ABC transporter permease subunit n=1 Tax=Virgibacillus halodenitrificans TaxID=1482 RepID=UPI001EED918E|nr:ABC transporter permease subunit [Virgibacillus halodenitrificans]MCG1027686.1 ABC transporter permease subunit [Virgibacillus halodenitrificans]WHX25719.1 ABC transporter permease subunit [Virgibacillus halodenitrificans]
MRVWSSKGNLKIIGGISFVVLLVFFSFFPDLIVSHEKAPTLMLDDSGNVIAKPPYSPMELPPFGTNNIGEPLLYNLLAGAKYTILFVTIVCLFRFIISSALALIYAFYIHRFRNLVQRAVEIAYIIPPVIIVFFLLAPMLFVFQENSLQFMLLLAFVLIGIGTPPLALLIGDEIKGELQMDYIKIARLQGVSNFYIFKKHIWRIIKPRIGIFFIQNNIQLLLLLIHLGVLGIFIGGSRQINMTEETSVLLSITNEWGGLIGSSYKEFLHHPWIVLAPLFSFMLLILLLKIILSGIEESTKIK